MIPDTFTIIANWKMQLSFNEVVEFCTEHQYNFLNIVKKTPGTTIVLCPSFPALYPLGNLFKNSGIALGAQDCSPFRSGAYTGEVCAESLSQLGCHFCIIGHSERRHYNHETNAEIADKAQRLLEQEVQPIICVGETQKEYEKQETLSVLKQQLEPVLTHIADFGLSQEPIYIAYEPTWSIGTGIIPSADYLNDIFAWLHEYASQVVGKDKIIGLIYGGSVSEKTVPILKEIRGLSGLLVGKSSLDFQKFYTIVNLYSSR